MRPVSLQTQTFIKRIAYNEPFLFVDMEDIVKIDVKDNFKIIKRYSKPGPGPISVTALCVNDLYMFTGHKDGSIVKINIDTGVEEERFNYHTETVRHLIVQDNKLYSNSEDRTLVIFDLTTKTMQTLTSYSGNINMEPANFTINDNKLYYVGENERQIVQYDLITNQIIKTFKMAKPVFTMLVHDSLLIVSQHFDKTIRTLNLKTGKKSYLTDHSRVNSMVLDNKNNLYLASFDHDEVIKINLKTKEKKELFLEYEATGLVSVLNKYVLMCNSNQIIPFNVEKDEVEDDSEDDIDKDVDSNEDKNYTVYIYTLNNEAKDKKKYEYKHEGKYENNRCMIKYEIHRCMMIKDIKEHLTAGKNTIDPSIIMTLDVSGKVVVSLPETDMFFTYGSVERLLRDKTNTSWVAMPITDSNCEDPVVYKLYTQREIDKNIQVKETKSDYPFFLYDNIKDSFDNVTKEFVNQLLNNQLINNLLK